MPTYFALIEKDTDSAFGISFPDVPGCFSAADEVDDVLRNAIEALELHLEDDTAPKARALDQVAADRDVRQALETGAYLLAVPLIRNERRPVRINISLDKGTVDAIDNAARRRGLTRSAFIAEASLKEAKIA